MRITAQLIDALTGAHIWAERFDGALDDIFELQDQVASSVAGVIEPALQAAEIRRSAEWPTNDLTAYDLYLRALALTFSWERDAIVRALDLLERAIEHDPRYGAALAQAARCHQDLHVNNWTDDPEESRRRGIDLARRSLQVTGDDPNVLASAGYTLGYFGEEIDVAIALLDRALKLNPSCAGCWQRSGWLRLWAGQPDPAIEHFQNSLRLDRASGEQPFHGDRRGPLLRPAIRRSQGDTASVAARKAELGTDLPLSRVLLRTNGAP